MKSGRQHQAVRSGFTLAEMMIATGINSVLFAALLLAMITLKRSYDASSYYAEALADQTRALDYIVRDVRGALSVTVSVDANTLALTLPDYYSDYDAQGFPVGPTASTTPAPRTATTPLNVVTYGPNTITVTYLVSNRSLIRRVQIGTNAARDAVIATEVDNPDFDFSATDSAVTAKLTFSSRFRGIRTTTEQSTVRSATIYVRNHKTV